MGEKETESKDPEQLCQSVFRLQDACGYQRRYTARRAGSGSVTPTQRMTSSIHACCHPVMRAARPKDQAAGNQALEVELPKI